MARCGKVLMLTKLPPEELQDMHITACSGIEQLVEQLDLAGKDVYLMPFGGGTVPYLQKQ